MGGGRGGGGDLALPWRLFFTYLVYSLNICDKVVQNRKEYSHNAFFLKNISNLANKSYFLFAFKFILIFRECINTYKNIELQNSIIVLKENIPDHIREFTQYYDAEQAPEMCNEFITDYLNHCDFFGFDKIELPEIIDIVQHFCYWMFENNYTSSRLSLLNL